MARRQTWYCAACFAILLALPAYSWWQFASSRRQAHAASQSLAVCQQLATQVQVLRRHPTRAALQARSATELARQVEQAAECADLPTAHVQRIDPLSDHRVGSTAYRQQSTGLMLDSVSLKQLISFLLALTGACPGLEVSEIRLDVAERELSLDGVERWQSEVTLTHLIFSHTRPAQHE